MTSDARDPAYWSNMYSEWERDAAVARVAAICSLHESLSSWKDTGSLDVSLEWARKAAEALDDLIAVTEAAIRAVADRDFVPVL